MAFESPDGRFIYYTKDVFSGGRLRQMPVTRWRGGEPGAPARGALVFLRCQRRDLFDSGARRRRQVFHPVSELRHRKAEDGRCNSNIRTAHGGPFGFT